MASKGLTYDGEKYRWTKSFPDLQSFVTASLNITGKWTSPDGDAKLFKSDGDGEFVIKWHGPRSKRLAIQSDNAEQYLKLKFESSVNRCQTSADIMHEIGGDVSRPLVSEACSCVNESFVSQLISLKADIATLESRFRSDLVSEISVLRSKHKDLASIIRKQDDIILKLSDDNSFLKSRLLSLEKRVPNLSVNDFENNGPAAVSVIGTPNGLVNIDNNQPTDLNVNTLSVNSPASVSIINIPDEPESIINDQPIVPNADLATGAKLPNTCKSNKETMRSQSFTDVSSTNTATTLKYSRVKQPTSTKLPNYHNNMVAQRPKYLTPCPFLRRKGFCKKGDLCDFQHNNFKPIQSHPVRESQFSTPSLPHFPSSANQIPFPWNPNLFPPIQFPMSYPYLYPPPLMKVFTSPPRC